MIYWFALYLYVVGAMLVAEVCQNNGCVSLEAAFFGLVWPVFVPIVWVTNLLHREGDGA